MLVIVAAESLLPLPQLNPPLPQPFRLQRRPNLLRKRQALAEQGKVGAEAEVEVGESKRVTFHPVYFALFQSIYENEKRQHWGWSSAIFPFLFPVIPNMSRAFVLLVIFFSAFHLSFPL